MNTTLKTIESIKLAHHVNSDYAVAKLLGITKQAISGYRNKNHQLDDSTAFRAAKLLQIDPADLLTNLHKERAANDDELQAWITIERICDLRKAVKNQKVIDAMRAAANGKASPSQRKILAAISEQCILCSIDNFGESVTFTLDS